MIKKALHRVIVLWILYGAYRIIVFANPYVMWLMSKILGPSPLESTTDVFIAWGIFIAGSVMAVTIISGILLAYSEFTKWLFHETTASAAKSKMEHRIEQIDKGQDDLIDDMQTIKKALKIEDEQDDKDDE